MMIHTNAVSNSDDCLKSAHIHEQGKRKVKKMLVVTGN